MDKNTFIKISLAIFVFLSLVISLFPPFEFGNDILLTSQKLRIDEEIIGKLPIKQYDFIFNYNKKNFILSSYVFSKKFTTESLAAFKKVWKDKKIELTNTSIDSFYTAQKILYRITSSKEPFKYTITGPSYDEEEALTGKKRGNIQFDDNKVIRYPVDKNNNNAINYSEVKKEYEKLPDEWSFRWILKLDSTKKYYNCNITQPVYYLLNREILLGEILVEYILAFFVSLIFGFIIQKFYLSIKKIEKL